MGAGVEIEYGFVPHFKWYVSFSSLPESFVVYDDLPVLSRRSTVLGEL